jgi:DNA-binding response OmpR family regulator
MRLASRAFVGSRVLIVEDDSVLRKHLVRLFVREGFEVHTADHCAAARHQLLQTQFDTLLLDVALPDGSGLDVLAEVGERQRPRQTLVMTAFTAPENELLARRLNVSCLLRKPIDLMRLVEVVRGNQPRPPGALAE